MANSYKQPLHGKVSAYQIRSQTIAAHLASSVIRDNMSSLPSTHFSYNNNTCTQAKKIEPYIQLTNNTQTHVSSHAHCFEHITTIPYIQNQIGHPLSPSRQYKIHKRLEFVAPSLSPISRFADRANQVTLPQLSAKELHPACG